MWKEITGVVAYEDIQNICNYIFYPLYCSNTIDCQCIACEKCGTYSKTSHHITGYEMCHTGDYCFRCMTYKTYTQYIQYTIRREPIDLSFINIKRYLIYLCAALISIMCLPFTLFLYIVVTITNISESIITYVDLINPTYQIEINKPNLHHIGILCMLAYAVYNLNIFMICVLLGVILIGISHSIDRLISIVQCMKLIPWLILLSVHYIMEYTSNNTLQFVEYLINMMGYPLFFSESTVETKIKIKDLRYSQIIFSLLTIPLKFVCCIVATMVNALL